MGLILDLKNLFTKNKVIKVTKKSLNRSTAEEQMKIALKRNKSAHLFGGARDRNLQAIYIPQNGRFKGWMRENRKYSSFKKKRA